MHLTDTRRQSRIEEADWERFGSRDPYFSVLTEEQYHTASLNGNARDEFFASGRRHIDDVLATVRTHFLAADFKITRALDFGCGVGRLLVALSPVCQSVTGVDVSDSMLREAKLNCENFGAKNVHLLKSLSGVQGNFDLVHSVIVIQHIPRSAGEDIMRQLIELLREGGIGVIHLPYDCGRTLARKLAYWAVTHLSVARYLRNVIRRNAYDEPYMQMNEYDLNRVFKLLHANGCDHSYVRHCYSRS